MKKLFFAVCLSAVIFANGAPVKAQTQTPATAPAATAKTQASTPAARPQTLTIGIIDMRKLVDESTAGKSLIDQLKTRRDSIQKEANDFEKKLKDSEQAILKDRNSLKPEEFEARRKAFEQQYNTGRDAIVKKSNALDASRRKALTELQTAIAKASADVADARKIQVILDRQAVVIAEQTMDVTGAVMTRLNETVKTISIGN